MAIPPALRLLLAAQVLCTPLPAVALGAEPPPVGEQVQAPLLRQVVFEGGSVDDGAFARAAAALPVGLSLTEGAFQLALEAVRNTDRFRRVTGALAPCASGVGARIVGCPRPSSSAGCGWADRWEAGAWRAGGANSRPTCGKLATLPPR